MKKIFVVVSVLAVTGFAFTAQADSHESVTSKATITFVANPNLPKPTVPSNTGGGGIISLPQGTLPKTGEASQNLALWACY